jgi:hypothetical protein
MMKVGDIVVSNDPSYSLCCGSGVSAHAIVVQINPVVLVSQAADMRWEVTVQPKKLMVIGAASKKMLNKCMTRLEK